MLVYTRYVLLCMTLQKRSAACHSRRLLRVRVPSHAISHSLTSALILLLLLLLCSVQYIYGIVLLLFRQKSFAHTIRIFMYIGICVYTVKTTWYVYAARTSKSDHPCDNTRRPTTITAAEKRIL